MGAQAYSSEPVGGWRSSLGLGKYYHDMSKNFYKSNHGKRNFCKVLQIFLLYPVVISFFNRLYLRNWPSWTPQTLDGHYDNFRTCFQIRSQNLSIMVSKIITFSTLWFQKSSSHQLLRHSSYHNLLMVPILCIFAFGPILKKFPLSSL